MEQGTRQRGCETALEMGTAAQFQLEQSHHQALFKEDGNLVITALGILVFREGSTFLERLPWVLLKTFIKLLSKSFWLWLCNGKEGPENTKICLLLDASLGFRWIPLAMGLVGRHRGLAPPACAEALT